eukprot:jgi/Psemu1/288944/fgenesh1_pg.304_\
MGGLEQVHVPFAVPWDWQPTTSNWPWVVHPLKGITLKGVFGALFPAFMLFLLFFINHNISSIMQSRKYNLKKPPTYHWDFFVLGLTIIPYGAFGLPPGSGLILQAPLHTRALCTRKYEILRGRQREVFVDCEEQEQWSPHSTRQRSCLRHCASPRISWIVPVGCLFGIFLYFGIGAMHGNEIRERITLIVVGPDSRPQIPVVKHVPKWTTVVPYSHICDCPIRFVGIRLSSSHSRLCSRQMLSGDPAFRQE